MTQLVRKRVILAGLEDGGSALTLTSANAIECSEPEITPLEADDVERTITRPYLGSYSVSYAGKRVTCSFKCELKGSGAAGTAPNVGVLLRGCGFDETINADTNVEYSPLSEGMESCEIWFYADDNLHKLTGARGTVSCETSADQISYLSFTFTGLFNTVSQANAPTNITPLDETPVLASDGSVTYSIDGYSGARLSALSWDCGNEVNYIGYQTDQQVLITDRKATGSMTIESPRVSDRDFFTLASSERLVPWTYALGGVTGNTVEFASSTVQIGKPAYSDISGIQTMELGLTFVPGLGNDELTISFR